MLETIETIDVRDIPVVPVDVRDIPVDPDDYALPNVFTMSFYHPWQPLVNCAAAFALLRSGQINIPRQRHVRVPV